MTGQIVENKITEGVIWKEVIFLFLPIIISAFFQNMYTFVDGMIVGEFLGAEAFSAVGGSAAKIINMHINFFVGVSGGITAYTARYYGKGDLENVKNAIFNGLTFFTLVGSLLSIIGVLASQQILSLMGTPVETFDLSSIYLKTFLVGLIFCILYNTLSGILRALGDAKSPLYILVLCGIINIVLDLVFVVEYGLGVLGVALATLIAQGVSALLLGLIVKKKLPKIEGFKVFINYEMIKEICIIGIPAGIQSIMYSLSNILVQSTINSFGYMTVAAWSAYVKIDSLVEIFVSSLGNTVITFVGQNLGAKHYDRVRESVKQIIKISYMITVPLIIVFITFRTELLGLFSNQSEVVTTGETLFFIIMPMYLLGIPQTICVQALRGLGKSMVPMLLTLGGIVGIRVIWVLAIFPMQPTIQFLGLCYPISGLIMSIVFGIYYKREVSKLPD